MRKIIDKALLVDKTEEDLLTAGELEEAVKRKERDENGDDVSLVHYMDLRATYDLLLRNRDELPHALTSELTRNAPHIQHLVPIRHRVMHGRPLNADDAAQAISILDEYKTRHWASTKETLARLRKDPTWEPFFEKLPVPDERTLHNLPEVDYDETSFIGRKEEADKLLSDLKRRRDAVITVTGEGGIGKTALALDVAYKLLDSADNPYEAILWVSLKTERLTANGVEEIRNAIQGIPESIVELGKTIDGEFSGRLEELAFALDGISSLIIIDNLESVRGDEVVEMYDKLPTNVNYLFTSRVGIGQIERRFALPPLGERESVLLLRKFASARGQRILLRMSEKEIRDTVGKLRYSPLAIRWYVLSAESGRVPLDVISNQKELLDFCVRNVYEGLGDESHVVLNIIRALDRAIGFNEFSILTNFTIDVLRKATQELTRGSLVSIEADPEGSTAGRLALTETARTFLPIPDGQGLFIAEILRREHEFRTAVRAGVASHVDRIDTKRVFVQDEKDRPAAFLLSRALKLAKSSQFDRAHEDIRRAEAFSPEYSEVHRVAGHVYLMEGRIGTAVEKFRHALDYVRDDISTATACFELANVLARQMRDTELALPQARRAYDFLPNAQTALLLGRILTWSGDFDEGQRYVEEALEDASGTFKAIGYTALVDNWSRWSDAEIKAANYQSALEKSSAGIHIGVKVLREFSRDEKLAAVTAECAILTTRASNSLARRGNQDNELALRVFTVIGKFIDRNISVLSFHKRRILRDAMSTACELSSAGTELWTAQTRIRSTLERSLGAS